MTRRVVLYALDGTNEREIWRAKDPDGYIIAASISPDGGEIAISEQVASDCFTPEPGATSTTCGRWRDVTVVKILDVETGDELVSVPQTDAAFDGLVGAAAELVWHEESDGVVIFVAPQSEMPAHIVTLRLDGSVTRHPYPVYHVHVSPDGHHVIADDWEPCGLSLALERHEARIMSLDDDRVLASIKEPERNVALIEWSPDGEEFLVRVSDIVMGTGQGDCPDKAEANAEWLIMRASGEAPVPAGGIIDARRRWYGDRLIEYRCRGEEVEYPHCKATDGADAGEYEVVNQGRVVTRARYLEFEIVGYAK
jgi:hypothetical protein